MNSDRKAGLVTVALSMAISVLSMQLEAGLVEGAIGAAGTPMMIGFLGIAFGLILIAFPDGEFRPVWPDAAGLKATGLMLIVLLAYGYLLEIIGFIPASIAFMFCLLRLFKCGWRLSAVISTASSLGMFILFDFILSISLPIGNLIRPWIS